jgi:hypothetical protein
MEHDDSQPQSTDEGSNKNTCQAICFYGTIVFNMADDTSIIEPALFGILILFSIWLFYPWSDAQTAKHHLYEELDGKIRDVRGSVTYAPGNTDTVDYSSKSDGIRWGPTDSSKINPAEGYTPAHKAEARARAEEGRPSVAKKAVGAAVAEPVNDFIMNLGKKSDYEISVKPNINSRSKIPIRWGENFHNDGKIDIDPDDVEDLDLKTGSRVTFDLPLVAHTTELTITDIENIRSGWEYNPEDLKTIREFEPEDYNIYSWEDYSDESDE